MNEKGVLTNVKALFFVWKQQKLQAFSQFF